MLILCDPQHLQQVPDPLFQQFLHQRFLALSGPEPYQADRHGFLIVVEPGDTAQSIAQVTGCTLFQNDFEEVIFPDPEFVPGFDCLEDQGCCFEIVYTLNDDDFTIALMIPKLDGIDADIQALALSAIFNVEGGADVAL